MPLPLHLPFLPHLNVRSIINKLDHIVIFIQQTDPDILVLTESWLRKNISNVDIALPGYNIFRADRDGRGGGVAVYVKSDISVTVLDSITKPKFFEFISLRLHLRPTSIIVIGIYRPPSANRDSVKALGELLARYQNDELIITGDFNLNWLNSNSDYLKEIFGNLNLTQLITDPTRPDLKDHRNSTLIDLIFCNKADKIIASGVFDLGLSDHCPTACIRSTHLVKPRSKVVVKRNLKHFNKQAFLTDIELSDISSICRHTDAQLALLLPLLTWF